MIISIEGHEATGKTTFAYTAPLPIVGFSLDMGSDRAIYGTQFEKYFKGLSIQKFRYKPGTPPDYSGDITIYEMPQPIQLDDKKLMGYMEQWNYFIQAFAKAVQDESVATIVIDTMTLLRKNKCDAYLQELQTQGKVRKQLQQIEYGHPDGAIRSLYTFCQSTGKNLVAVHHLREHYVPTVNRDGEVGSAPDGTWEVDGVRDTNRYVDVTLRNNKNKKGELVASITKCGPNLQLEGDEIPNATWNKVVDRIEVMGWNGPKFPRRSVAEGIGK